MTEPTPPKKPRRRGGRPAAVLVPDPGPDKPKKRTRKKAAAPPAPWSKLTPDVQNRVVRAVRAGAFYVDAARFAGIGETTLHRWLAQGRAHREAEEAAEAVAEASGVAPPKVAPSAYRDFYEAVNAVRAEAETRALAIVSTQMEGDWKAATWWLAKVNPLWRDDRRVELVGDASAPIRVEVAEATPAEALTHSQRAALVMQGLVEVGRLAPAVLDALTEDPDDDGEEISE